MSDKIKPHHLERKAILYIRQSTAYQVSHNLESQKLQYAMQDRLQQLGWREIEVARSAISCVHPARRDLLETPFLRNDLPNSDQPGLRRCLCLR
jgi:hypothetical protein